MSHTIPSRFAAFLRSPIRRLAQVGTQAWLDETKLSLAERRFIEDDVEGHHMDAVVQGTFGGGDPNRLLDSPRRR